MWSVLFGIKDLRIEGKRPDALAGGAEVEDVPPARRDCCAVRSSRSARARTVTVLFPRRFRSSGTWEHRGPRPAGGHGIHFLSSG